MMKRGHKNSLTDLTAEYLRSILHYDPITGLFTWKVRLSWRGMPGKTAGRMNGKNRIKIGINNKEYMAHRLAWLYMKSEWPEYEIDHIDEDQSNNIWKNLRHATPSQNHRNRGPQKNNKTGYKGVCFATRPQKFLASIKHRGKTYGLGLFSTAEEAYDARCKAAKKMHGKWAKL
jgi:hypothetical protein